MEAQATMVGPVVSRAAYLYFDNMAAEYYVK